MACSPQAPAQNASVDTAAQPAEQKVAPEYDAQTGLREVPLTIKSANGEHRFTVEVAGSPQEQEKGMMFRRSVAPDHGMIFPYYPPQNVAFWMKNTLIPLDIIYIDADNRIARITQAKALDLTPLPSGVPVSSVLEIGAGRAAALGLRKGDAVSWTL